MIQLDERNVRTYLETRFGGSVRILGISVLGQEPGAGDLKGYGYGVPVKIDYELSGKRRSAVLETVTPGPFGHEHMADRAQILLWSHAAFNQLPGHVHSLDVGSFCKDGALLSLGNVEEFFIYRKAQSGQASTVPGVQASYEAPEHADVVVSGHGEPPETAAHTIVRALDDKGYVKRQPLTATS